MLHQFEIKLLLHKTTQTQKHAVKEPTGRTKLGCAMADDACQFAIGSDNFCPCSVVPPHFMIYVNVLLAITIKTQCASWNEYT